MANGEVIEEVRALLKDPKSMTSKTAQRLTLSLLANLYDKVEADHERTDTLWTAYLWGRWLALIVVRLGVTDLVTNLLKIIRTVP